MRSYNPLEQSCEAPMNRLKEHSRHPKDMRKEISHSDPLGTGQGTTAEKIDIEGQPTLLLRTLGDLGGEGGWTEGGVILNPS